jgi:hypothetical protein
MMPNRTVSEGGTGPDAAQKRCGSSRVTLAAKPAAAPAPHRMKSRRLNEYFSIIDKTSFENDSFPKSLQPHSLPESDRE